MADRLKRHTIVLADDHPVVLSGLKNLITAEPDFDVLAAVSNGAAALDLIRDGEPDLALLDVSMPLMTGAEVLAAVAKERLPTRVVLLTASATDEQLATAVSLGVSGLLMKDTAAELVVDCLRTVAAGRKWLLGAEVLAALDREKSRLRDVERLASVLTPRERQLVELVAEGLPNKLIARELGLTDGTVKIHLHNVYQKLGVRNRTELAALAFRHHGKTWRRTS